MTRPVKRPTRPYRSPVRVAQALDTRRRILEAAARLFIERGYAGTTVAAVAGEAGASEETIYVSFGNKRALLEGVIDQTIMGPQAPIPLPQQLAMAEIEKLPTPRERLRAHVEFACSVLARTAPVHAVIRGAADSEPSAVDLRRRVLAERIANNKDQLRKCIGGALRPGLTSKQALERFTALSSPELYYLLTVDLGWTPKQYRDWLVEAAERELLGVDDLST